MPLGVRSSLVLLATWPLGACAGWQSALDPQALQADQIRHTLFVFLVVAALVWIGVVVILGAGLLRRKRATDQPLDLRLPFEERTGLQRRKAHERQERLRKALERGGTAHFHEEWDRLRCGEDRRSGETGEPSGPA